MSKVRDFAEKKDTSIPDVILKATKSSVFRINEKLHNVKQGLALTNIGSESADCSACSLPFLCSVIICNYSVATVPRGVLT